MKNLISFVVVMVLLVFMSCDKDPEKSKNHDPESIGIKKPNLAELEMVMENVSYIKDKKTGLCFLVNYSGKTVASYYVVNLTCVPCDSLKNVTVHEFPNRSLSVDWE